jgi:hypothetical protein
VRETDDKAVFDALLVSIHVIDVWKLLILAHLGVISETAAA